MQFRSMAWSYRRRRRPLANSVTLTTGALPAQWLQTAGVVDIQTGQDDEAGLSPSSAAQLDWLEPSFDYRGRAARTGT